MQQTASVVIKKEATDRHTRFIMLLQLLSATTCDHSFMLTKICECG